VREIKISFGEAKEGSCGSKSNPRNFIWNKDYQVRGAVPMCFICVWIIVYYYESNAWNFICFVLFFVIF